MESEPTFKFLPTQKDKPIEKDSLKLTVLCYNLLASMHSTLYQFPHCQPEHLNFKERFPKAVTSLPLPAHKLFQIKRVKELNADVLCLQVLKNNSLF